MNIDYYATGFVVGFIVSNALWVSHAIRKFGRNGFIDFIGW